MYLKIFLIYVKYKKNNLNIYKITNNNISIKFLSFFFRSITDNFIQKKYHIILFYFSFFKLNRSIDSEKYLKFPSSKIINNIIKFLSIIY